jgi:hypothetical protein
MLRPPEFSLIGETSFQIGDRIHPVQMEAPQAMAGGRYFFRGIDFLDEQREKANAGLFIFPPNSYARTVLITDDVRCQENAVQGYGWCLKIDPKQGFQPIYLNSGWPFRPVEYSRGTILSYVAMETGLEVLGLYTPPFTDQEQAAEEIGQQDINGVKIPPQYWDWHRSLTGNR